MTSFISIAQASTKRRQALSALVIRPSTLAVLLLCGAYAFLAVLRGHPMAAAVAVALAAWLLHALRRCCAEVHIAADPENLAECMDAGLMARVHDTEMSLQGLVNAAVDTVDGRRMLRVLSIDATRTIAAVEHDASLSTVAVLQKSKDIAAAVGTPAVSGAVVLAAVFTSTDVLQPLLNEADLTQDDVTRLLRMEVLRHSLTRKPPAFSPESLRATFKPVGRSWVAGYTNALDTISTDYVTDAWATREGLVVAHGDTIDSVLHVLARREQHNVLLLGRQGVGKSSVVRNAMTRLRAIERSEGLPPARIVQLATQYLISGRGDSDAVLLRALAEAENSGRVILIIPEITQFLSSASPQVHNVLLKFLSSPTIHVVATGDNESYHSTFKQDAAVDAAFEKFLVEDASDDDVFSVLLLHSFLLEQEAKVTVSYKALMSVIDLARRYLTAAGGMPGRAIAVLDDAVMQATKNGESVVTEAAVRDVVSLKAKMNISKMTDGDRQMLLTLEDRMKKRIIGQDEAITAVVSALKRARLDIHSGKRPIGTFLFLGPTGVGKTQTAKVLAEEYFGSGDALVRLDMNEFSSEQSIHGIIGSTDGDDRTEGFLAKRVQDRPFSVILLDEIEKAHPRVLNLFLQLLDEGFLMDASGARTDFRNTIIIATSNAGALFLRDFLSTHGGEDRATLKASLIDAIIAERTFSPEFINRFDAAVLYYPMTPQVADTLGRMLVQEIVTDVQRKKGIAVTFSEAFVAQLVQKGFSEEFGAREMRRVMTENVENAIADELLKRDVKRGDTIVIGN